jgi:N4-gp56 family major capsid protein
MPNTTFATGDALTKKVWSAKLYKEAMRDTFFSKFMGESANSIVQVKKELTKSKGDKITFGLRMRLTGSGQSSSTGITLEGNEEALTFYDFAVSLTERGNAVKAGSTLDLQRPAFDLRTEMKDALKEWIDERIEKLCVTAAITSPTSNRVVDKTLTGNMLSSYISQAKRVAQLATPKIRPIKIEGGEYYVMLAHPYVTKALKAETAWKNAQYYSNIRGKKNPIFSGVMGLWDGVLVYEYDRSDLLYDTSLNYAISPLLGAQALAVAWGSYPSWNEKLFDYDTIPGVGTKLLNGVEKTKFNDEDFGVVAVKTKYTPDE